MSSSSASSSGACQSQAPAGLPGGVKGDNPEGDQGGGNSSVNQPQPSQSVNKAYSYGPSSLRQAAGQMKDDGQEGGAQGDRKPSVSDFHNLDFSGHFKIKLLSRKDKQSVLKLKVNEEQFVKFCHLFHCELKLEALKQALLSDLKVAVTGEGYPPSICPQEGASHPIDISINRVLTSLCYQLKAVNISSSSWNTDQVKDTLSLLDSYQKGIVIGYEVSDDDTNCWLVGECGTMRTTMEALGRKIGPFRYQQTYQQEPNEMETTSDRAETAPGNVLYRRDMLHSGGSHESDNGRTGQTGSDHRQTRQTGSDRRQTRQTGSDNSRQTAQTGSDNRETGQTGSDNRQTGQSGSDNRQTGQSESDRQTRQTGSDRQTIQTDLDRQKIPSRVKEDMRQSGSESKPPNQIEFKNRCQSLPESGDRRSGQTGSSQSETDNITGNQLVLNVMVTAQVSPDEPKDQIMERSQRETDVYKPPFEAVPGGQGDRAREVTVATSRTEDKHWPGDQFTRKEKSQSRANFNTILKLDILQSRVVSSTQFMKDYEHKFKNIRFEYACHRLHISGDEGTVDRVSKEIQNQLEQIEKNRVDLSSVLRPKQMSMLRVSGVLDYVKDHIKRKGMSCYLEQDKDTTRVYTTQGSMSDILNEIQVAIFCQEFEIDSTWRLFVYSPYVQQEMCNLQKKHHDKVAITVTESLVNIVCTSDISEEVLKAINTMKSDFSEAKTKTLPYTLQGHLTVELCTEVLHDQLNSVREKYGVEISPIRNKDKQGWIVKGPAGTLEEACEDVKKRTAKVVSESVHLKDKVCKEFFESKPGQNEMVRVGEDTGTLVTIDKKEVSVAEEKPSRSDITGSTTHRVASLTSRQWRLGDGSHVALYYGDGRTSPDNILVELKTGDPTSGVKLPPHDDKQYVVTLTIPEWKEGVNKEKDTIHKMFKEIITAATERNVTCLTILLDSGWDGKKACKQLVKNTLYVLKHDNAVACSCSYFTGDQEKFKLIRNVIDESFNDDKSVTIKDKGEEIDDYEMIDGSDAERKPHLVKGELAKMTSEVIVNTTRTDLRLDQGAVSLSILKAAGQEIQRECDQYYHGVKHGEVAVTHGYNLKCTYVFHGALPHYSTERMNRMEVMERFMRNCLKEADKRNCKTISFPALGTGNLGYPKDLVAHTMFDAVKKYFQEKPDSCVEGVNFVVYHKDRETVKAFEDEDRKPKAMLPVLPSEKTGVQLRIGTVDLWVTLGQIERSKAESLLIFWDNSSLYKNPSTFYFNEGLNPTGFQDLKRNRTSKMMKGETVFTEAGTLHFGTIIHCPITIGNIVQLKNVMNALKVANELNFPSLAISLGRKEQWTRFKETIVTLFYDALRQCEGRYKTLRSVEIIFDDPDIYKSVESHIRSTYSDKLVGNYSNTGTDVAGATGGVDGQRDDNYNRSTGQPTGMAEETHLVVVSQTGDNMGKAIRQLQNKITELQLQQSDRPPLPPRSRKEQIGSKSPPPTSDTKDNASVVLTRTEYEKKRLIVTSNSQSALDKERIENWLGKTTGIDVICPFRDETEALIIFQSKNDAKQLVKQQGNDEYRVTKFPKQTVQNVKANLKSKIVQEIHTRVNNIVSAIYDASGTTWEEEDSGTCYLRGSLPEIQCAYKYIVRIITDEIKDDVFQDKGHADKDGGTRKHETHFIGHNDTQNQRPKGDRGAEGHTAVGGNQESSHLDTTPLDSDNLESLDVKQWKFGNGQKLHSETSNVLNGSIKDRQDNRTYSGLVMDEDPTKHKRNHSISKDCEEPVMKKTHYRFEEELSEKREDDSNEHHGHCDRLKQEQNVYVNQFKEETRSRGDAHIKCTTLKPNIHSDDKERGESDQALQYNKQTDQDKKMKFTCSAGQFPEICFFNPGINENADITFNNTHTECYIIDRSGCFQKAKDLLSHYARREISNLTETEAKKLQECMKQQKENMTSMNIFCEYSPKLRQVKLVGEQYDAVEQTEHLILKDIGRPRKQQHQHQMEPSRKNRMLPPSGSKVFKTDGGVQVFVYQGDILNLDVNVIVCGTDKNLQNSWGLSAKIAAAAGHKFDEACNNVLKDRALTVTEACFTGAGNLHYDSIIHAVIPMWSVNKKSKRDEAIKRSAFQVDFRKTIENALLEAISVGARSVALPAIGYAHCPKDILTSSFSEAICLVCKQQQGSSLRQVHIVDQNQDILDKIKNELQSEWVRVTTRPVASSKRLSQHDTETTSPSRCADTYTLNNPKWLATSKTGGTCSLTENLNVCIILGIYTRTQTEAFVSIEDEAFGSKRYVAKEIAKAAGDGYRNEIEKQRQQTSKLKISDVIITSAGGIPHAKKVLHVIGPVADKDILATNELFKGYADNIRACIYGVLRRWDQMNLASIALPNFASGQIFKTEQTEAIWQICVEEVERFAAQQTSKSTIKIINLVSGADDVHFLMKTFQSKIRKMVTAV